MRTNTYFPISHLWYYNFMGGLADQIEIDLHFLDRIYKLTAEYLHQRHNFICTQDSRSYNTHRRELHDTLMRSYPVPTIYFTYYWELLYRDLQLGFQQLPGLVTNITTINNDKGDIIGFVVTTGG